MSATDADLVVTEVRTVTREITEAETLLRRLKRRRVVLFKRAVRLNVSTSRLAIAARVEPGTVRQILKRSKEN